MTSLAEFINLNRNLVIFGYALVFFTLGISLALQTRTYSRLALARNLKWLAAFGLVHGVYEWGQLFIPIQSPNMSEASIELITAIQLLLLAISYSCLMGFGLAMLPNRQNAPWLRGVPVIVFSMWTFVVFIILLPNTSDYHTWVNIGNSLSRYFISFPGALISSYSLYQCTKRAVTPLDVPHIARYFFVASGALFFYAFFSGLIPPPVPFFPGNTFNAEVFAQIFTIPVIVVRSMIGLVMTVAFIRGLEIFDLEYTRHLEEMEKEIILAIEKERLARELHDGAIQSVYSAGLLVNLAKKLLDPDSEITQRLERAATALDHTVEDLRQSLDELRGKSSTPLLINSLHQLVQNFHLNQLLDIRLDIPNEEIHAIPSNDARHIYLIMHEAISNVVRHARANSVHIQITTDEDHWQFIIQDDGIGMEKTTPTGYGIRNMLDRARLMGGDLEIKSVLGKGTTLIITYPKQ